MEAKRIIKTGKMHGVYRCGKRAELMKKVPQLEKLEEPVDVTGIIIAGILNFGSDAKLIKELAKDVIGCDEDSVKIPYEEMNIARNRFIVDVITRKLRGSCSIPTAGLIRTFYEFMDMPTETTKLLQAESDIRDVNRYLHCEHRTPVIDEEPTVTLLNTDFQCQQSFFFEHPQVMQINRHKVGKRYVYDEQEVYAVESVRIFPGKPKVKQDSKTLDGGTGTRLELYVMLKAAEQRCIETGHTDENVLLKASYYYLQKTGETDENYKDEFFGKGGNVITIHVMLKDMKDMDDIYMPQLKEFLKGESVPAEKCQDCASRVFCGYKNIVTPLNDDEKPMPGELPALSKAQEKAANALDGYVRVIATAGSGKTTTMAYRIMNLLKNGVEPEKIGCFTFTNTGAAEMRDRIKAFCTIAKIDADVEKIYISTIHSFGDSLMKKYYEVLGYKKPPVLINEIQKTKIIERILSESPTIDELLDKYKNFYLDMFKAKGILEIMKDYFTQLLEGKPVEELRKQERLSAKTMDTVLKMYFKYSAYKREMCLIEHADQEIGVLKLLKLKPDLFEEIGIEHISVDEYQDTSNIQFNIINEMRKAPQVKSLFIVGDDDQSIYGFRDANVRLIMDFFSMIGENGQDIQLMENRRSTGNIVDFASKIIANNNDRLEKNPVSANETGKPVRVESFTDKTDEQKFIIQEIEKMVKEEGKKEDDIAILAPTNSELQVYAEVLGRLGIKTISINPEFVLENSRVVGAVSLVKFMMSESEFHGMNYINVRNAGETVKKTDEEIHKEVEELQGRVHDINTVTGLFEMFAELDPGENDEIYQAFLEDIRTAKDKAVLSERLGEVCEYIIDFDRFGRKQTARKEKAYDGVVLSTMHSSKGKEWPVVFCSVTKMHNRDLNVFDIPEKNRLLFVACTRAKKELYVTGVNVAYSTVSSGPVENMFLNECIDAAVC